MCYIFCATYYLSLILPFSTNFLLVLVRFQLSIYKHVKELFPERPWLDVVSKADLLDEPPAEVPAEEAEAYVLAGPAGAMRVSVQTEQGLDEVHP